MDAGQTYQEITTVVDVPITTELLPIVVQETFVQEVEQNSEDTHEEVHLVVVVEEDQDPELDVMEASCSHLEETASIESEASETIVQEEEEEEEISQGQ